MKVFLFIFILFLSGSCFALDFKGLRLGDRYTPEQLEEYVSIDNCKKSPSLDSQGIICMGSTTIANYNAAIYMALSRSGKLKYISLTTAKSNKQKIYDALVKNTAHRMEILDLQLHGI